MSEISDDDYEESGRGLLPPVRKMVQILLLHYSEINILVERRVFKFLVLEGNDIVMGGIFSSSQNLKDGNIIL